MSYFSLFRIFLLKKLKCMDSISYLLEYWEFSMGALMLLTFLLVLTVYRFLQKRKKQRKKFQKKIIGLLKKISIVPSAQKVLEYDKILTLCLAEKGLKGSTGQKMMKYNKKFLDKNNIWFAHKLRNKIAHEIGFEPRVEEIQKAERVFSKEIRELIAV
jgi:hypothetical protein